MSSRFDISETFPCNFNLNYLSFRQVLEKELSLAPGFHRRLWQKYTFIATLHFIFWCSSMCNYNDVWHAGHTSVNHEKLVFLIHGACSICWRASFLIYDLTQPQWNWDIWFAYYLLTEAEKSILILWTSPLSSLHVYKRFQRGKMAITWQNIIFFLFYMEKDMITLSTCRLQNNLTRKLTFPGPLSVGVIYKKKVFLWHIGCR